MTTVDFNFAQPLVEELPSEEESSSSSITKEDPLEELSSPREIEKAGIEELIEEAQGCTLGRILAGAIGGLLYGGVYVITRLSVLAIAIPLVATVIPGAIVGTLLGILIGGCRGGGDPEAILEGLGFGAVLGGCIAGLPMILAGLVIGG